MRTKLCLIGLIAGLAIANYPAARAQETSTSPSASAATSKSKKAEKKSKKAAASSAPLVAQVGSSPAPAAPSTAATPATATAPSADPVPAPAPAANAFDSVAINGFVDGYYSYDFQHPHALAASIPAGTPGESNPASELAGFTAFTAPQEQLSLNMIELIINKAPSTTDRLGFDLAFGYGDAMNVVNSSEPGGLGYAQYLKEGYLSYLAPVGKGLEIDFGKFVTSMGQEVIETNGNWNYTRGILFTYAIPFYHFGVRTKYTFNDKVNVGLDLVNGWNDIVDNNTGKSLMFTLGLNPTKKISWTSNYMAGPEMPGTNSNWRQEYDTEVGYNPTSKLSLALNYDYARGDQPAPLTQPVWWSGVAGYVHYAVNSNYSFTTRYEYFDDHNGFATGQLGKGQDVNEVTLTLERDLDKNLITRLEFRRDMSNVASLFKGTTPVKDQNTLALGVVYTFDIHDAH